MGKYTPPPQERQTKSMAPLFLTSSASFKKQLKKKQVIQFAEVMGESISRKGSYVLRTTTSLKEPSSSNSPQICQKRKCGRNTNVFGRITCVNNHILCPTCVTSVLCPLCQCPINK